MYSFKWRVLKYSVPILSLDCVKMYDDSNLNGEDEVL